MNINEQEIERIIAKANANVGSNARGANLKLTNSLEFHVIMETLDLLEKRIREIPDDPDDDFNEPLPERTCNLDDESCESCQ